MKRIIFIFCLLLFALVAAVYAADADVRDKRSGAIGTHLVPMYPLPDGTIDANDRGQAIGVYPLGSVGGGGTPATSKPKESAVIRIIRLLSN